MLRAYLDTNVESAIASGQYDRWKQFAESCMAEYDLNGWTANDLVDTGRFNPLRSV